MKAKKKISLILLFLLGLSSLYLQGMHRAQAGETVLKQTAKAATVDGIVEIDEYSYSYNYKQLSLYLNKTSERLYAAVTAETEGWVGVGFDSSKMDNADIIIGYIQDGKTLIKEQKGSGKKHIDSDIPYVKSYAMKESSGKTTLEVELILQDVIKRGQKTLSMIMAYGKSDSLSKYHKLRAAVEIELED